VFLQIFFYLNVCLGDKIYAAFVMDIFGLFQLRKDAIASISHYALSLFEKFLSQ
jgi:hypothetical protein